MGHDESPAPPVPSAPPAAHPSAPPQLQYQQLPYQYQQMPPLHNPFHHHGQQPHQMPPQHYQQQTPGLVYQPPIGQPSVAIPQYHAYNAPPPVVQASHHANPYYAQQPPPNSQRYYDQIGGIPCKKCRAIYPMPEARTFRCKNCGEFNSTEPDQCLLT